MYGTAVIKPALQAIFVVCLSQLPRPFLYIHISLGMMRSATELFQIIISLNVSTVAGYDSRP